MSRLSGSLRARLIVAHLAVVIIGAVALVVLLEALTPRYFEADVQSMNEMMAQGGMMTEGGMMHGDQMVIDAPTGVLSPIVEQGLLDALDSSLRRSLLVAVLVSGAAALALASLSIKRILAPLEAVRSASRQMAAGSYAVRIDPPAEAELAAVANDVNKLAEALDETEHRRVRLISEVAHELRTPLATIEGYLEGLLDGVFQPDETMFAAWDREVRRLKRLTADLGELSRAEEGAHPLHLRSLDLCELTSEVVERLRPQFEAAGVHIEVAEASSLVVEADHDRMAQVLVNVIGNALAYTGGGGSVRVEMALDGRFAVVDVSDTGRGLTAEQQMRVFERFYRTDPESLGGTGIGLTIAQAIVRRHGGEITVASPGPGRGSTFSIRVPHKPE